MIWNLEEAMSYYRNMGAPADQPALVNLLKEIQQNFGGSIPSYLPAVIAETYGVKESLVLAIVKRIPSLRLADAHCLEMCAGPNCGKHRALADFAEKLSKERSFALKFVPCMRMCGKGPNVKWDGKLYHGATEKLLDDLTKQ